MPPKHSALAAEGSLLEVGRQAGGRGRLPHTRLSFYHSPPLCARAVAGIEPSDTVATISLLRASHRLHNLQVELRADRAASRGDENIAVALNVSHRRHHADQSAVGSCGLRLVGSQYDRHAISPTTAAVVTTAGRSVVFRNARQRYIENKIHAHHRIRRRRPIGDPQHQRLKLLADWNDLN